MSRILALSDLHVDITSNFEQVTALSKTDFADDTLIVAGDLTDSLARLEQTLSHLTKTFANVAYVPGNHELWLRGDEHVDSIEKFHTILDLCRSLNVHVDPFRIQAATASVWIVPLFSWYRYPEEGATSLFIEKVGEDWERCGWMDRFLCRWPAEFADTIQAPADYFYSLNQSRVNTEYDADVISFSHFLPRKELIFHRRDLGDYYSQPNRIIQPHEQDPHPHFNFSRVAGCSSLDEQIRVLGSRAHIYGHQHRNRLREIDGVTYISQCLGSRVEQRKLGYQCQPKVIWESGEIISS